MKTAIVTGGSGGLGRACAKALIKDGFRVGLFDMDTGALNEAAAETGAEAFVVDVTDEPSVLAAMEQFGAVPDLVVNNAGIGRFAPCWTCPLKPSACNWT